MQPKEKVDKNNNFNSNNNNNNNTKEKVGEKLKEKLPIYLFKRKTSLQQTSFSIFLFFYLSLLLLFQYLSLLIQSLLNVYIIISTKINIYIKINLWIFICCILKQYQLSEPKLEKITFLSLNFNPTILSFIDYHYQQILSSQNFPFRFFP